MAEARLEFWGFYSVNAGSFADLSGSKLVEKVYLEKDGYYIGKYDELTSCVFYSDGWKVYVFNWSKEHMVIKNTAKLKLVKLSLKKFMLIIDQLFFCHPSIFCFFEDKVLHEQYRMYAIEVCSKEGVYYILERRSGNGAVRDLKGLSSMLKCVGDLELRLTELKDHKV